MHKFVTTQKYLNSEIKKTKKQKSWDF